MTIKAECHGCGHDCSNVCATYMGDTYHIGCIPSPQRKSRERFCWNCGDSMGDIEDRYYERTDTCGKLECQREAQNDAARERDEAHEQLDRENGWTV